MYEFRHSDKKLTWWMPEAFRKEQAQKVWERNRRILTPWRRVAAVIVASCVTLCFKGIIHMLFASPDSTLDDLSICVLVSFFMVHFLFYMPLLPGVSRAEVTKRAINGIKWRSIACWRVIDAPDCPRLRAVEFDYSMLCRPFTQGFGFDPEEVDESIVTDFLRRIAPEKEKNGPTPSTPSTPLHRRTQ